jgi:hypothetical protein
MWQADKELNYALCQWQPAQKTTEIKAERQSYQRCQVHPPRNGKSLSSAPPSKVPGMSIKSTMPLTRNQKCPTTSVADTAVLGVDPRATASIGDHGVMQ